MDATYISTTQFSIVGNYTDEFIDNRRIKVDCGVDGYIYCTIQSSYYSSPNTVITIKESNITSNIESVLLSIVIPGSEGGLPDHYHTSTVGDGKPILFTSISGTPSIYSDGLYLRSNISGTEWAVVDNGTSTFLELTDTPSSYDSGKYLIATTSGLEWVTTSGIATWLFGTTTPTNSLGEVGNYFLNTDTGEIFKKIKDTLDESDDLTSALNTTVSGNYTSGSPYTPVEMAFFDDNTSTLAYRNSTYQAWSAYDFNYDSSGSSWAINKIRVHSFRTECWYLYFYGSNDAVNWTLLHSDTFTAIDGDNNTHGWNEFTFDNTTPYRYIKVAQDGTNWRSIDELEFIVVQDAAWEKQCTIKMSDSTTSFLDLSDTPSDYNEGMYLISTTSGLAWTTISGGGSSNVSTFLDLTDTPTTYSGGMYLISTVSGLEWTTISGAAGATGDPGADGTPGTIWYHGTTVPVQGTGIQGDFYLNTTTSDVYCKDTLDTTNMIEGGTNYSVSTGANPGYTLDGNTSTAWTTGLYGSIDVWWKYDFGSGNAINVPRFRRYCSSNSQCANFTWEGSNDDSNWDILYTVTGASTVGWHDTGILSFTEEYRYYRIHITYAGNPCQVNEIEFLGETYVWDLKGNFKGADGNDAPTTFSGLTDTPSVYDTGKYLRATSSGTEWATVSGGSSSVASFLDLTDTPSSYDTANQYLMTTESGVVIRPGMYMNKVVILSTTSGTYSYGDEYSFNINGAPYYFGFNVTDYFYTLSDDFWVESMVAYSDVVETYPGIRIYTTDDTSSSIFSSLKSKLLFSGDFSLVIYMEEIALAASTAAGVELNIYDSSTDNSISYFKAGAHTSYTNNRAFESNITGSTTWVGRVNTKVALRISRAGSTLTLEYDDGQTGIFNTFGTKSSITTGTCYVGIGIYAPASASGDTAFDIEKLILLYASTITLRSGYTAPNLSTLLSTAASYISDKSVIPVYSDSSSLTISGSQYFEVTNVSGLERSEDYYYYGDIKDFSNIADNVSINDVLVRGSNNDYEWKEFSFTGISGTPNTYEDNKYLKSTTSGIEYSTLYIYGTTDPPAASNYAEGTLYFKYID